ncbi:MAG: alpha/beta fold hydrolase [Anaerolineales bacterium]|nr:alpha/beta fold hydrolase [Anaerolineales bacterium]
MSDSRKRKSPLRLAAALCVAALGGYLGYLFGWILKHLLAAKPTETLQQDTNLLAPVGVTFSGEAEEESYSVSHTIESGIERIVYTPKERKHETPILMLHGMWHGAWCWRYWQQLFAQWGWESIAFSLPGHANSPVQRPLRQCTLDYYLSFLVAEVERLPRKPILFGHSMGGALAQWYFKYVGELPAAVLVAPWVAHSILADGFFPLLKLDPLGCLQMFTTWDAAPFVRNPEQAARKLISARAILSPEDLHAKLGPESALVLFQHNPPFWTASEHLSTPMLWLVAEEDAVVGRRNSLRSAAFYQADYMLVRDAGHDLMLEHNYLKTAESINRWLANQEIE